MTEHEQKSGIVRTLIDNSFLLIAGAVGALIWANMASPIPTGSDDSSAPPETSYTRFVDFDLTSLWSAHEDDHSGDDTQTTASPNATEQTDAAEETGEEKHGGHHGLTIHFVINDILMALFFAIAAKEVWESLLPGGALSNPRKAATPLLATVGGIAGPALVYVVGCYFTGTQDIFGKGWAVPCATDIAFSYLIARMIFGVGHPAIAFLLLLAIADDAAGLMILAVFYPQAPLQYYWFLLTAGAMALAFFLRTAKVHSHWVYLLGPGILCWYSFYQANIHAALGLVPIIPFLPHAHTDLGMFAKAEKNREDTLNEFEHFWKTPVEFFLGLFGLANAGVVMSSLGTGTWLVLGGLLLGKPLGITAMTLFAEKGLKLQKPAGMDYRHVVTLGMVAGIGFTVALFVSVAAFTQAGPVQDSVKMGALLSFAAAPLAILIAKMLGVRPEPRASVNPQMDTEAG
ncbi:MAG: sodium:proton antiporter [Rhodopirellula sp.]|nr:sodium:proton antiporter [Rhodopirellula sp.]